MLKIEYFEKVDRMDASDEESKHANFTDIHRTVYSIVPRRIEVILFRG